MHKARKLNRGMVFEICGIKHEVAQVTVKEGVVRLLTWATGAYHFMRYPKDKEVKLADG